MSGTFKSLPAFLFRPVPHVRVVNQGAEAFRLGEKGAIVGRPITAALMGAFPILNRTLSAMPASASALCFAVAQQ